MPAERKKWTMKVFFFLNFLGRLDINRFGQKLERDAALFMGKYFIEIYCES
jgi:hypothetical protein